MKYMDSGMHTQHVIVEIEWYWYKIYLVYRISCWYEYIYYEYIMFDNILFM